MKVFAWLFCTLSAFSIVRAAELPTGALPTPVALPKQVYGLDGEACLVRFDAIINAPIKRSLLFDVESGPGAQSSEALVWRPSEKKPGGPFRIGIYSGANFEKLAELSSEFVYCNPKAVRQSGKIRWLAIGDSLTAPGFYIGQTVERLAKILPQVSVIPVGSALPPKDSKYAAIHHEGRGGWHWQRYLEGFNVKTDKGVVSSPFVFGPRGRDDFDFARYLREKLGGETPEIITIFLGANDIFGASPTITPEKIGEIMERAKTMTAKIQAAAPDSIIGIIPPPSCSSQSGFAENYGNGVTEWQYRRALQLYNAALLQTFDNRQNEHIYIVPGYLGFDPANSFPSPPNALHPKEAGFTPVSLEIGAWIVHLLSTKAVTPKLS